MFVMQGYLHTQQQQIKIIIYRIDTYKKSQPRSH